MPNLAGLASQASSALSSTLSQAQTIASGVTGAVQNVLQAGQSLTGGLGQVGSLVGKVGGALGLSAFQTKFSSQDFQNGSALTLRRSSPPTPAASGPEGPFRFPLDTPKYSTTFVFFEYKRPEALQNKKVVPTLSVTFPMPGNLMEEYGVQYKTPALGAVVGTISDLAQKNIQSGMTPEQAGEALRKAVVSKDTAAVALGAAATKYMEGVPIIGSSSEAVGAAISRAIGAVPNPHLAVIFEQVGLRTHTFTYRFSPNSKSESEELKKIIRKIKKRILPSKTNEAIFVFPNLVRVKFNGLAENTILIKDCVVEDFKVNYTPQGSPAFFSTGDPAEVEVTLQLREIEVHTAEDIKE